MNCGKISHCEEKFVSEPEVIPVGEDLDGLAGHLTTHGIPGEDLRTKR